MKAIQIKSYGGPEVLEINEIEKPTVKPGHILVENHAASINPFDVKLAAGYMKEMIPMQFPYVVGGDFAGVVIEVGQDVQNFKVGDEVYGQAITLNGGSGAFAEFLSSTSQNAAKKPSSINFDEAAALPLVSVSALQALEDEIHVQSGQKVLIHGGAGGIGHIAIQIAKSLGAYVATTASTGDVEFVKSLGADQVIDYKKQKFEEELKDFDSVFDTVANKESFEGSLKILKKGGILVSMLPVPDKNLAEQYGITAISQQTGTTTERLNRVAELVDAGKIKINIDSTFSLDQAKEAFEKQNTHPKGKVVFHIK